MIGSSVMQSVSPIASGDFSVSISPPELSVTTTNGRYTSPTISALVYNAGNRNYEFVWFSQASDGGEKVIIDDNTAQNITFSATGYNSSSIGYLTCFVVNVDNPSETVSSIMPYSIYFR